MLASAVFACLACGAVVDGSGGWGFTPVTFGLRLHTQPLPLEIAYCGAHENSLLALVRSVYSRKICAARKRSSILAHSSALLTMRWV